MDTLTMLLIGVTVIVFSTILGLRIQTHLLRRRVEKVLKGEPLFYIAMAKGVTLLVRARDYETEFENFRRKVEMGEKNVWDTIFFQVAPAFVFYNSLKDRRNFCHSGSKEEALEIVLEKVRQVSGLSARGLKTAMLRLGLSSETVAKAVVKETSHLYVPFLSISDTPRELEKFGIDGKIPTLAQAREALLAD